LPWRWGHEELAEQICVKITWPLVVKDRDRFRAVAKYPDEAKLVNSQYAETTFHTLVVLAIFSSSPPSSPS
jgi:hypothetical protein